MLRVPGRYKLLAAWSIAALAGYGMGELEVVRGRWRWVAIGAALLAMTLTIVCYATHRSPPTSRPA